MTVARFARRRRIVSSLSVTDAANAIIGREALRGDDAPAATAVPLNRTFLFGCQLPQNASTARHFAWPLCLVARSRKPPAAPPSSNPTISA
jgi:hypothetical protein